MPTETTRPNILFILTDDQGWDDCSLHGNTILQTPAIDRLGRTSARFDNYYVAAVCAPTRASLLTGRHFLRTGVSHVHGGKDFVHPDEIMIGQLFQQAGYATGMWGKWHSGNTEGYFPWERGFDEAYMAQLYRHRDSRGRFNGEPRSHSGWTVDTLTDYCIDFIDRHNDGPWFAFLPHLAPHAPLQAPEGLIEHYRSRGCSRALATVYAMVHQIDASVDRLLRALDERGLGADTIVCFQSDNGPAVLDDVLTDDDRRQRYVTAYKGHKGDSWENGIRSPLFMRWPRSFPARRIAGLADVCDILPTLCDCCGIEIPADHPRLDGRSIRSWCMGMDTDLGPKESWLWVHPGWPPHPDRPYRPEGYFDEYRPVPPEEKVRLAADTQVAGLRVSGWKFMQHPGCHGDRPAADTEGNVLIAIDEDPLEDRNLAVSEADRCTDMRRRTAAWFTEVLAEPHSFHAPRFILDEQPCTIPAKCCGRIDGAVRNTVPAVLHWTRPGEAVSYHLAVRSTRAWRISLDYTCGPRTGRIRLSTGTTAADLDLDQAVCSAVDGFRIDPSVDTIRVELIAAGPGSGTVLERLDCPRFEPLHTS
ncbi:MAG: sulfatase-like hydrolase/transferase [Planctomycetota bacterium]